MSLAAASDDAVSAGVLFSLSPPSTSTPRTQRGRHPLRDPQKKFVTWNLVLEQRGFLMVSYKVLLTLIVGRFSPDIFTSGLALEVVDSKMSKY